MEKRGRPMFVHVWRRGLDPCSTLMKAQEPRNAKCMQERKKERKKIRRVRRVENAAVKRSGRAFEPRQPFLPILHEYVRFTSSLDLVSQLCILISTASTFPDFRPFSGCSAQLCTFPSRAGNGLPARPCPDAGYVPYYFRGWESRDFLHSCVHFADPDPAQNDGSGIQNYGITGRMAKRA